VTVIDRRAARVLLIDAAERTLLLHGGDPARPDQRWWFTPGGGLDEGETPAQGAARELHEETGLKVEPEALGEPVHHDRQYRQTQDFFLLRVPEWQVDTAGLDADEQRTITDHRWWSAPELDAATEQIFPAGLAGLLRRVL
jgi:8-oxo-dGTP pyrophosphatase MutT (NUDIX family)